MYLQELEVKKSKMGIEKNNALTVHLTLDGDKKIVFDLGNVVQARQYEIICNYLSARVANELVGKRIRVLLDGDKILGFVHPTLNKGFSIDSVEESRTDILISKVKKL